MGATTLDGLLRLEVPVPPMLEEALGYTGPACYVGFYWQPKSAGATYSDGRSSAKGADASYLIYTRHPLVAAALATWHLGSSTEEARDELVLDRRERVLYAGPEDVAERVLEAQWPSPARPEAALTEAERLPNHLMSVVDAELLAVYDGALAAAVARFPTLSADERHEELEAWRANRRRLQADLAQWLEDWGSLT